MRRSVLAWGVLSGCQGVCEDGRELVRLLPLTGDVVEVCAAFATDGDARRAGLTAYPKLQPTEGLVLQYDFETPVCITTTVLDYNIDIVFVDSAGVVLEVGCNRAPEASNVCVDDVLHVLEVLPRASCADWVGGTLDLRR